MTKPLTPDVIYKGKIFQTGNERHNEIELYHEGKFFKVVLKSEIIRVKPEKMIERAFRGLPVYELTIPDGPIDFVINLTDSPLPGCEWHRIVKRRSLNPSPDQLQRIKSIHLGRRFYRTKKHFGGETPAYIFRGQPADALHKWLNDNGPLSVYRRMSKYGNNFNL